MGGLPGTVSTAFLGSSYQTGAKTGQVRYWKVGMFHSLSILPNTGPVPLAPRGPPSLPRRAQAPLAIRIAEPLINHDVDHVRLRGGRVRRNQGGVCDAGPQSLRSTETVYFPSRLRSKSLVKSIACPDSARSVTVPRQEGLPLSG